ncbi:recombinase family protein [Nonomuraea angiospora]|uniref:recombinase family protein n=1 Tax=Nonomuraea angiospora TaxID=46172 RepID=UPI00340020E2
MSEQSGPVLDEEAAARQNLVLDEAGIEDPVVFEEDPGTSSRLHPLQRPKFRELLTYARPGDTVHISETFRLVRGTRHTLDVLDVLHRDQMALRLHDGAFSAMDLAARHPRTGELLSTVKSMAQTLATAGELQRDLPRVRPGARRARRARPRGAPTARPGCPYRPCPAQSPARVREPRHRPRSSGLNKITGIALTTAPMFQMHLMRIRNPLRSVIDVRASDCVDQQR